MMFPSVSLAVLAVVLLGVVAAEQSKNVVNFNIFREDMKVLEVLDALKHNKPSRLGKYSFTDCGDPKTKQVSISTLTFSPDPISFPGTLGVNFAGSFLSTLDAPIKAEVVIKRRIGTKYIKIPCIGNIGSCTYDDICELLAGATCPDPFVTNGVPCKCPFTKGSYKLPNVSFDIDSPVFPPGDYMANGTLFSATGPIGCVAVTASFD